MHRELAFGVLGLYIFLMLIFARLGRVYSQDEVAFQIEASIFVLAFCCEWFVIICSRLSTKLSKGILRRFWEKHKYWVEGCLYRNEVFWADRKHSNFDGQPVRRDGAWPSMSDNFATFGLHVLQPQPFFVIMIMLPSAMLLNMFQYGQVWYSHVHESLALPLVETDYEQEYTRIDLAKVVFHPRASCEYLHFVPIPYSYNIAKVVLVSFVQDILFGSATLLDVKDKPLPCAPLCFSIFTVLCVVLAWVNGCVRANDQVFGNSLWSKYEGVLYCVNLQSGVSSLLLLTIKMFCETNVNKNGAPPGLGRLGSHGHWRLPGATSHREKIFWVGVTVLALGFAPLALTHILPMTLVFVLGIFFPLWAPVLALFAGVSYAIGGKDQPNMWLDLIRIAAGVHCQAWQSAAVIGFMTVAGVLLRKWLWELHVLVRTLWAVLRGCAGSMCEYRSPGMSSDTDSGSEHEGEHELDDWGCSASDQEWDDEDNEDASPARQICLCTTSTRGSQRPEDQFEPHGPYGFNLACYQVFFTLPLLAYCNAMISAGVAIYCGSRPIQDVFMADFASRELVPFNQCLISSLVPLRARFVAIISLL